MPRTNEPRKPCETWTDHVWSEPRFVENGRHETMGRYTKFMVVCERCGKETTETRWIDILARLDR